MTAATSPNKASAVVSLLPPTVGHVGQRRQVEHPVGKLETRAEQPLG
jgi:hypothetical protein